mgnify:CR=1 FL=1
MLIRLRGDTKRIDDHTWKLNLDTPVYYLADINYSISVRMICINLEFPPNTKSSPFWKLSTNLVDKSAFNPNQEIYSFYAKAFSNTSRLNAYAYAEPAVLREYKMQLTALHNAEFILTTLVPHPNTEIHYIEILLEISRYARL